MNKEFEDYATSKLFYIPLASAVILSFNAFLTAILKNPFQSLGFDLKLFLFYTTPISIVFYAAWWFVWVKAEFEKTKNLQVADDAGRGLSVRRGRDGVP